MYDTELNLPFIFVFISKSNYLIGKFSITHIWELNPMDLILSWYMEKGHGYELQKFWVCTNAAVCSTSVKKRDFWVFFQGYTQTGM